MYTEKDIATHSSTLTWKIQWMEGPGGLPSMGSYKVRHDWSDLAAAACMYKGTKKSREMITIKTRILDHHPETKTRQRYHKKGITGQYHWWYCQSSVNPKGNQSWVFIGRTDAEAETPIIWPLDVKNWLIGKDPDAGEVWRQEEKGTTEDEVVGWHHQLAGHEFE